MDTASDDSDFDFDMEIVGLDFSSLDEPLKNEEIEDVEEAVLVDTLETNAYIGMSNLFASQEIIEEIESVEESIVEDNGFFVIPKDLKIKNNNIDAEFKTLVDSVLK